ncbi:MAG: SpoIID/LytB domain-containing protein, partial [Elusimicrobiota bacterium]
KQPQDVADAFKQGNALYARASYQQAESAFLYILTRDPKNPEARAAHALTLEALNKPELAMPIWLELSMERRNKDPRALFYLGRNYLQRGYYRDARKQFIAAIAKLESDGISGKSARGAPADIALSRETTLMLALSQYLDRDYEGAVGNVEYLYSGLGVGSAFAEELAGRSHSGMRRWDEAIKHLNFALSKDNTLVSIRKELAAIYAQHADFDSAYLQARRYLSAAPDSAYEPVFKEYAQRLTKAQNVLLASSDESYATAWPRKVEFKAPVKGPAVTVGLFTSAEGAPGDLVEISVQGSERFNVTLDNGTRVSQGKPDQEWRLLYLSTPTPMMALLHADREVIRTATDLIIDPVEVSSGSFLLKNARMSGLPDIVKADLQVRGKLKFSIVKDGYRVVNILGLEEYLYGVVPYEIGSKSPRGAILAQAVLARSYALWRRNEDKTHRTLEHGYDLCDAVHCQVYKGFLGESDTVDEAVAATSGMALEEQGKAFQIWYHANCGGLSASQMLWDIPKVRQSALLPSELDPFRVAQFFEYSSFWDDGLEWCFEKTTRFSWIRMVSLDELRRITEHGHPEIGTLQSIAIEDRSRDGRVAAVRLIGSKAATVVEGDYPVRKALAPGGLRSSLFTMLPLRDKDRWDAVLFIGRGYGHGKGGCQVGMIRQAKQDIDYKKIIKSYYPQADIVKRY